MYYVVRALSPYTEYEFIVTAVNNIGRGSPSIAATCTTGETGKLVFLSFFRFRSLLWGWAVFFASFVKYNSI